MTARPIYVGVGSCECGRVEVRLYQVPSTKPTPHLLCDLCLEKNGFSVPKPRTADDIETVNGEMRWKR